MLRPFLSSNVTYGQGILDNLLTERGSDLHRTDYMAVNTIWNPFDQIYVGVEYLYGVREDLDGDAGAANRLQTSIIYNLR